MLALILQYTIMNNELCDALLIFLIFFISLHAFVPLGQEFPKQLYFADNRAHSKDLT